MSAFRPNNLLYWIAVAFSAWIIWPIWSAESAYEMSPLHRFLFTTILFDNFETGKTNELAAFSLLCLVAFIPIFFLGLVPFLTAKKKALVEGKLLFQIAIWGALSLGAVITGIGITFLTWLILA